MILSLDTGMDNYGYSVLERASGKLHRVGVSQPKKYTKKQIKGKVAADYVRRFGHIFRELKYVMSSFPIEAISCELPTFGFKSADAAISLTFGATVAVGLAELNKVPLVHVNPTELKELFTGNPKASKEQIMALCCEMYGWETSLKDIREKSSRKLIRQDTLYHLPGSIIGAGKMEHIADSIAAFYACKKKGLL